MSSMRNTLITVGIGLAVALVLKLTGLSNSGALIGGAIVAIVLSVVMQRRNLAIGGGANEATSDADISAALQSATETVDKFETEAAGIAKESTRTLAGKIGDQFSKILVQLEQPQKREAAPLVIDQLIEPGHSFLTEYIWLTNRGVAAVSERTTTIENTELPAVEVAARQTLAVLEKPGQPDMNALRRVATLPIGRTFTVPPTGSTETGTREITPDQQ